MKNRVIKFRAWDGETKEMFSWEQIGRLDGCTGSWCYTSNPNWILMQFTSLHDSKGKEIYEGDIVAFIDAEDISTENGYDFRELQKIGTFEWLDERLGWHLTNRESMEMDCIESSEIEIIGNIYENPELLNN